MTLAVLLRRAFARFAILALLAGVPANPLGAEPAPVTASPGISILSYGVYCPPRVSGQMDAPETESGSVNLLADLPRIARNGQEVPAVLGLAFGLVYLSDRDLGVVRFQALRPGRETPEIYYGSVTAGENGTQGFTFETPSELEAGRWRFESWSGDTLLYRVEFDVLPADALPGLAQLCGLTS